MFKSSNKIAIIGMGYVGLPLAVAFAKKFIVTGYDINLQRINKLKKNYDETNEVLKNSLKNAKKLNFTSKIGDISDCNIFIITVPTPVFKNNQPNLKMLISASKEVGKIIKKNDIIIYESTVYPGVTEEICIPILEKNSKQKINKDFFVGYSPERVNPGDKSKKITDITKIVSGSNKYALNKINKLYLKIITAGTYEAKNIKIAEAAKVIENTQRDLNIALINELSIIFEKLKISTEEVLKAAETKWNFLSFRPGLVGGHCIGVDPYYLTYKSKKVGYVPKIILAGRKLNDDMPKYVFKKIYNEFKSRKIRMYKKKILIMGLTFKENCPDIRNSKVINLFDYFKKQNVKISTYDPVLNLKKKFKKNYNLISKPKKNFYDCVIIAVKHKQFIDKKRMIKTYCNKNGFIFDLKYILKNEKNYKRV